MPATASALNDAARASALLQASALLLEVGESGLALAGLERAEALQSRVPRIKRARAIALAQQERHLDAARALMEELALAPDDGDAFRTFLGMMDRVPQIRALPRFAFFRQFLWRLDEAVERRFPGRGHGATLHAAAQYAALVLQHGPAFELAFAALGDDESRDWMLEVASLAALGDERVRLPFDEEALAEFLERTRLHCRAEGPPGPDCDLPSWDLSSAGLPMSLLTTAERLAGWVHLGRCDLAREGAHVGPCLGDVVIESRGGIGDSALWLAHRVGRSGRVYAFEHAPEALEVFRQNLERNPALASRVELYAEALTGASGERTPGRLCAGVGVAKRTVDDFVQHHAIDRVDLIRLDLGGEERGVLEGARKTIARWRPRLVVSVSHAPADLAETPARIAQMRLGYRLFLSHFGAGVGTTVVFAVADSL